MKNKTRNTPAAATIGKDDSARLEKLISELESGLVQITGEGMNVRLIGESLPTTGLDQGQICPELLFPLLGQGIINTADGCFSVLSELEYLLRNKGALPNVDESEASK